MIKPITISTIVSLFLLTTTIQATDNPIPFDEAAAKAQARELKAKILKKNQHTKDLYRDRASEFPDIQEKIKEKISEKMQRPMMKMKTVSFEELEASKEFLKKTTIPLPKDEEAKYATPFK